MNKEIKCYLTKATRGLWGRKRKEVREELLAHIQERITAHRIAGMSKADATEKTLQELGHPSEVSTGMTQLHTLPAALSLGTLAAVACAVTVTLVSSTLAQPVDVIKQFPSPVCLEGQMETFVKVFDVDCERLEGSLWTTVETLRSVLEPQGVEVWSGLTSLQLTFPEAQPITLSFYDPVTDRDDKLLPEKYQLSPGHVPVWELVEEVARHPGRTLEFAGWDNPTLRLGNVSLQLGTTDNSVDGVGVYTRYLERVMRDLVPRSAAFRPVAVASPLESTENVALNAQRFDLGGSPGDIYGAVTFTQRLYRPDLLGFALDVAPADPDGQVTLNLPDVWEADGAQYVTTLGGQPKLGETLIVRLTGKADEEGFGYEVVPLEQISLAN